MSSIKNYYLQIDIIKALAILFVIIIHSLSWSIISKSTFLVFMQFFLFTQAVPLFLIIMGRNAGYSFKRRELNDLKKIFSIAYFKRRLARFFLPWFVMFLLAIMVGWYLNKDLYFGMFTLIGYLPILGPGNYFISMVLQFIFVFPFIYIAYVKSPKLTLFGCLILNILFDLLAANFINTSFQLDIYSACIFRYIFLIVLGLWAFDNFKMSIRSFFRNKLILTGLIISLIYLTFSSLNFKFPNYIFLSGNWGSENPLSFIYTLCLFFLGFKCLPKSSKSKLINLIGLVGKSSFHIFLFQIIYFGSGLTFATFLGKIGLQTINIYILGIFAILGNIVICLVVGVFFFYLERNINSHM